MSRQISIKKNFIMNTLLTMSGIIFPLITFPYVSRILLPAGTGKVNFATSLINYFAMFAQLGIPTYGIRATAQVRDNRLELTRVVHELTVINLIMTAFSYLALAVALITVPRLQSDRMLYLIVSSTMIFNAIGMEWMYKGLEQYTYITVRSVIFKFVALIAMFLLIHQQSDYILYGAISVFASSASSVLNFINARKYISMHLVGGYRFRRHWKAVGVFFAMSVATTVYTNLDQLMLGLMTTSEDVGYYGAAVKIKTVLVSAVTSLGAVLLPRSSYYVEKKNMGAFREVTYKALNFVMLVSVPLTLFFVLFAEPGIYLLSGPAYGNAVLPMQVIMPTLLLIGLSSITGIQILVPLGRENIVLYSEIAGAVTDLILNLLLIPELKSTGAALGTLAAEFVVLAVQMAALRGDIRELFSGIQYWKIILSAALGTAASLPVLLQPSGTAELRNFFLLLVGALLFFGVYGTSLLLLREPMTRSMWNQAKGRLHGLKKKREKD